MALGDLYFDVLLRDKTDQGINAIKSKLSKLGVEVGTDIAKGIEAQLKNIKLSGLNAPNLNVKATLNVDKNKILTDIQDALSKKQFTIDVKAKSNITTNANKSALAYETEAQAKLINAQARLLQAQNAQAVSAQKAALAQAKLRTEQQRTTRETNRAQIEATKLARQKRMLANATNRATQSARNYTNANRGIIGSLREMTGLAGKFSAIYMGGQFLSSLIKIRGEFEMQLVSLRAIMQSTERANELYGQLMQLSVISPFQFGDLVKYAKQLSAYQIPMGDLYDTTKRLADLSAGLGVDMNRLILAYGQVKSAAVLRGTELRQFTEAGLPMVSALADKFSELEGRVVSAGEVFDKISGREVPFQMVKEVLEDLTSEGGMFFEMQEKQAATLKGQISNLKDAYAIMMNEIGQSTDGILKGGVGAIRWSLQNYEELLNILLSVVAVYGAYRIQLGYKTSIMGKDTQATLTNALAEKKLEATRLESVMLTRILTPAENKIINTRHKLTYVDYELMVAEGKLNAAQVKNLFITGKITKGQFELLAASAGMQKNYITSIANMTTMQRVGERLKLSLAGVGRAFKTLGATMMASWPMLLIGVITELMMQFSQLGEEQKRINQEIKENAKQNLADIENFYKSHKVTFDALEMGSISDVEASKALEKTLEKIKQTAPSSALAFEAEIMMQDGSIEQLQKAHKILKAIEEYSYNAQDALNNIKINEDTLLWGAFGEGLAEDAQDFGEQLRAEIERATRQGWDVSTHVNRMFRGNNALSDDLKEATSEIDKFIADNQGKLQGLTGEALRVEIAGLAKVLKEQYKEVDAYGSGILLNYFEFKVGDFQSTFEYMASQLTENEKKALKRMKGQYSGQYKEEFDEIVQAVKKRLGLIFLDTQDLVNNISQLQAVINVKLNIETGGNYSDLQKAIGANMQFFANEKSYERVQKMFEGVSSYAEIEKIIQEQYAKLKGVSDAIKKQKNLNEAQQKELQNANADMKTIETLASNLGVSHIKPTTKGEKSQVDQVAKALQDQYKELKKVYDEWEKLSKLIGNENAKAELAKMSGFKELFEDANLADLINKMLTDGGDLELVKEYLKKVKGMTSKEALSFVETLEQALRSIQTKALTESVEKAVERINDALDVNIKKYQEWEKYYESTGNKSIASLLAYGDANAIAKSEAQLRKENVAKVSDTINGGYKGLTYEILLTYDKDKLDKLPGELKKAFKEAQDAVDAEQADFASKLAESYKNTMSIEEQVKALEATRDEMLAKVDKMDAGEKDKAKFRERILKDYANRIGELKSKLQDLLPVWDEIFNADDGSFSNIKNAMSTIEEMLNNLRYVRGTPEGQNIFSTTYIDEYGNTKQIELTSDKIKELREQYRQLADAMGSKNPFKALSEFIEKFGDKDNPLTKAEMWKGIKENLATIADMGADAAGQLGEMFSALGMEGAAEAMDWTKQALEGVSNIANGFANGGIVGGVAAILSTSLGFLTSIINKEQEEIRERIEESKKIVKELQYQREQLENEIDRNLGGAYANNSNSYNKVYAKMVAERSELNKQLADAEQLKGDEEREQTMSDINKEIKELDDQIRHFAEDTLKDLMDIDLKEWANNFGDALVEAFASGEDAASAFDKTVADMMKNVVKNMASLYILEPALKELQTYLFGTDGKGGVFGRDKHFSEEDLAGMKPYLDRLEKETIPAVEDLFEAIDTAMGGVLSSSSNLEGLSGGIKSITEDTANLLASYLNAVRADVALIAMGSPRMTTIAEAQLAQLNVIATNTSRSAVAVEAINTLLKSVTTTTSSGRVLKV
jgi:hypothetical protein